MKILLVNKFWYLHGGSERVVFDTKEILEKAGHEVEVFGMQHPKNIFENKFFTDQVDYHNIKSYKEKIKAGFKIIYNKQAKENFEKLVDEFKPDIIHFHNIYHQLSFSIFEVVKKKGIPSVMTLHDYKMISPNYNLFHDGKICEKSLGGSFYKTILHNCTGVLFQSIVLAVEASFRRFKNYQSIIKKYVSPSKFLEQKHIQAGYEENEIEVIKNPISFSEKLKIKDGKRGVVFVGRISKEKGIEVLIDAAQNLKEISFKIIGDGSQKKFLEEKCQKEKVENVKFTGALYGEELKKEISSARLMVVPSIWYENAPLVIAEAIQGGTLAIASDIGGISELLSGNLLFKAGDSAQLEKKISEWYGKSSAEYIALVEKLFVELKKEHSPDTYLQNLEKIYSELI